MTKTNAMLIAVLATMLTASLVPSVGAKIKQSQLDLVFDSGDFVILDNVVKLKNPVISAVTLLPAPLQIAVLTNITCGTCRQLPAQINGSYISRLVFRNGILQHEGPDFTFTPASAPIGLSVQFAMGNYADDDTVIMLYQTQ